jgi:hypothetical protein
MKIIHSNHWIFPVSKVAVERRQCGNVDYVGDVFIVVALH